MTVRDGVCMLLLVSAGLLPPGAARCPGEGGYPDTFRSSAEGTTSTPASSQSVDLESLSSRAVIPVRITVPGAVGEWRSQESRSLRARRPASDGGFDHALSTGRGPKNGHASLVLISPPEVLLSFRC